MPHVIDTETLNAEGWLSAAQADEIARRSQEAMVALAVNAVLIAGILVATAGLIFWLADPVGVAVVGLGFLVAGIAGLIWGKPDFRMLGNASAVIGAGMLIGGLGVELLEKHRFVADPIMLVTGAGVAVLAVLTVLKGPAKTRFAAGSILLMGLAMHLTGLGLAVEDAGDWWRVPVFLYAALIVGGAGVLLDVRIVTAFAILPLVALLAIGDHYLDLMTVICPPEATLTLILMTVVAWAGFARAGSLSAIRARHAITLATLAVIFANVCFFVGAYFGDGVGQVFLERPFWDATLSKPENDAVFRAYRQGFLFIPEEVFAPLWAIVLAVAAFWGARTNRRGVLNAAMTFGGIHAFGQVFDHFSDEPLAWAIAGLIAIPVAWGMWKLNGVLSERGPAPA